MAHLKVAVRIRPLSQREIHSTEVVKIDNQNAISITNLKVPQQNVGDSRERTRRFTFDYCFEPDSTQNEIFSAIEKDIENAVKKRYHSCVLAYGQSSSGKTHTMIGNAQDPGLIPKLCQNVFKYLEDYPRDQTTNKVQVAVSYLEIYNEKVRDLLDAIQKTSEKSNSLKVREHPKKGPYVQDLSHQIAYDYETIKKWLEIGKTNRSIAATLTNPYSSRSHSVFTLTFGEGVQLHLVDLAGSEKAGNKRSSISTFKEGANINKSLVALGNVISTLADSGLRITRNQRKRFIPYRDSVLTWLLKDTLGGNSKTVLIATVSPSSTCYTETINTLRFGQSAKKIVSCPVVNEDPKEKIIRQLQAEIATLKQLLSAQQEPHFVINDLNLKNEENLQNLTFSSNEVNLTDCLNKTFEDFNKNNENCSNLNNLNNNELQEFKNVNKFCMDSVGAPVQLSVDDKLNKYEKLMPIMDVTSDIKSTKQVPKMRRTFSVESSKLTTKPPKPFGSLETISNAAKDRPKRLSQPSIVRRGTIQSASVVTKPKNVASKLTEKGIVTEVKGPPKQELVKRQPAKPRSQIVAAVTNRLYGKVKKKEVATETDVPNQTPEEVPKELKICSNARLKLQELTRQALNAHRRRHVDTQTDLFPVLRVKEISTDSDDLQRALAEIKDAQTGTVDAEMKEMSVTCNIENFDNYQQESKNTFVLTRSCGTQASIDLPSSAQEAKKMPEQPHTSSISFKKYLQGKTEPTYTIMNPCTESPIYTSSVNFNVSHNYINQPLFPDTLISQDSLEEQPNNICFPTPDIISNHNSLEHGNLGTDVSSSNTKTLEEKYAKCDTVNEYLEKIEDHVKSYNLGTFNRGRCSEATSTCSEHLQEIKINPTYATEIYKDNNCEEKCQLLKQIIPKLCKPHVINDENYLGIPTAFQPLVLKPPSRGSVSNKPKRKTETKKQNEKIYTAMSKFMKEATCLMANLNIVAEKLQEQSAYDLEVTINGIEDRCDDLCNSKEIYQDFSTQTHTLEEASTQTSPPMSLSLSLSNTSDFDFPINKYEGLIESSCQKIENCIGKMQNRSSSRREEGKSSSARPNCCDHKFSEEDNSVHSNQTYSDYGSLTRSNLRKHSKCSPSDYLKKLTCMRKQIVEYSRDDFLVKNNF